MENHWRILTVVESFQGKFFFVEDGHIYVDENHPEDRERLRRERERK